MRQLKESLFCALIQGELRPLLESIRNDAELDMQIREDYINVYYKGGNILKINSPKSFDIDKMYFHNFNIMRSTEAKKHPELLQQYNEQRKILLSLLPLQPHEYFRQAKEVMDKWDVALKDAVQHNEKQEQQKIALANRCDTDYVVLDLEYAVSRNSEFAYNGNENKHVPRFDIIAIHEGQLVVIELKKGLGAIGGTSGIKPHMDCFKHTIGRDRRGLFVEEMKDLLSQKQALGLLDKSLVIKDEKTTFVFAFADQEKENEFMQFASSCFLNGYRGDLIYLNSSHKLFRAMKRDFYYAERRRQIECLAKFNDILFCHAKSGGKDPISKKTANYILRAEDSANNLFRQIIEDAVEYFKKYKIAWWKCENSPSVPSGHMVSSQIHCLNHLFALRKDELAIKNIMREATGLDIDRILPSPLDEDGYITFEFVYKNISLLGERHETRGANCTSIDAFVYAQLTDCRKILIPIEWKYTETYYGKEATKESLRRYPQRILPSSNLKGWNALYNADPYYELMRQTLLVEQIIKHKDCGIEADDFFHIMVIPNAHVELKNAIESKYIPTLKDKSKFHIIDPKDLLAPIVSLEDKNGKIKYDNLLNYLSKRYW